jgi:hypothetical protein
MKILNIIALVVVVFIIQSCDLGGDPIVGGTKTEKMAGEWFILVKNADGTLAAPGYHLISTSNTAANLENEMLLDDHELWPCKVKLPVSISALEFSPATALSNFYSNSIKVNIKSGKIIPGAAKTSGGNKTDSIYLKMEFTDDPGHDYIYAGYRRTGFLEDEH